MWCASQSSENSTENYKNQSNNKITLTQVHTAFRKKINAAIIIHNTEDANALETFCSKHKQIHCDLMLFQTTNGTVNGYLSKSEGKIDHSRCSVLQTAW